MGLSGPDTPDPVVNVVDDELDLSPRPVPAAPRRRAKRSPLVPGLVLALVLAGGAIVLFQGLSNATVYFCNADEVGTKASCSDDRRFRLQGTVDADSVRQQPGGVDFTVSYGGATIPVHHLGDPPELFQPGIPVVLEGAMVAGTFDSDRIMVKHTEEYKAANPDRVPADAP